MCDFFQILPSDTTQVELIINTSVDFISDLLSAIIFSLFIHNPLPVLCCNSGMIR